MDKIVDEFSRREELSYLAGLFDGEGCACIWKQPSRTSLAGFLHRSMLEVQMADLGPVEVFHKCFGGSIRIANPRPPRKAICRWAVYGQKAAQVASQLVPFSRNERKKDALLTVIDFGKTCLSHTYRYNGVPPEILQRRELLCNRCKALNETGSDANNQNPADLAVIKTLKLDTTQLNLWNE